METTPACWVGRQEKGGRQEAGALGDLGLREVGYKLECFQFLYLSSGNICKEAVICKLEVPNTLRTWTSIGVWNYLLAE